jgi:hypothetical protein
VIRISVTTEDGVLLDTFVVAESGTPEAMVEDEDADLETVGSAFANSSLIARLVHNARLAK